MGDYYTELTANCIKELRACNSRVVVLKGVGEEVANVDLYSRDKKGRDLPIDTLVIAAHLTNYEADFTSQHAEDISAAAHLYVDHSSSPISTVIRFLKAGDKVCFYFIRGNSNGYTKDAGLAIDHCELRVKRGKQENVFLLSYSVGKQNSARMTRNKAERGGWNF